MTQHSPEAAERESELPQDLALPCFKMTRTPSCQTVMIPQVLGAVIRLLKSSSDEGDDMGETSDDSDSDSSSEEKSSSVGSDKEDFNPFGSTMSGE